MDVGSHELGLRLQDRTGAADVAAKNELRNNIKWKKYALDDKIKRYLQECQTITKKAKSQPVDGKHSPRHHDKLTGQ